jgi:DNA helicase IV
MEKAWGPSHWGKTFAKTEDWELSFIGSDLRLVQQGRVSLTPIAELELLAIPGFFWTKVTLVQSTRVIASLDGIPNRKAIELQNGFHHALEELKRHEANLVRIRRLDDDLPSIRKWFIDTANGMRSLYQERRWHTEEHIQAWQQSKPTADLELSHPVVAEHLSRKPELDQKAVQFWRAEVRKVVELQNKRFVEEELKACKDFFDRVEKTPLTDEQSRAVLCFDNRVLTIASAGSGKTSTMVARAGYALYRNLFKASEILLLAFNSDAAEELQTRIQARLSPLGLPAESIRAQTFHAFGLDIIGKATGKRPTLAPWLEHGGDIRHLIELIDDLKDRDSTFRTHWDLFRVVLGRDLPAFGKEEENPEDWNKETSTTGFRTLDGNVVKSQGERLIADWLFYNGVDYQYEAPYIVDTADPDHRRYKPDFYYPSINVYHEHWALDHQGRPPETFYNYLEGMRWKKTLHRDRGTDLIETTMAQLWSGHAFSHLTQELTKRGVKLDPNPDRPVSGRRVLENEDLARTFRTFLTHAKSNRLSDEDLKQRLERESVGSFHYRHALFLQLFKQIRAAWEEDLRRHDVIDFEDMLNLSADAIESGYKTDYKLVMVDEFQDASRARARLARALVQKPGHHLFAVGDDWQSINRFAGADLSVMTDFEKWFGKGHTLRLERTFRCPQSICDISSRFVQVNPAQLKKKVVSTTPAIGPAIQAVEVATDDHIAGALLTLWQRISQAIASGEIPRGKNGKVSIYVLGRYQRDRAFLPNWTSLSKDIEVEFHTVHGSKGLEADYVFLPRLVADYYSFPSTIEDDPVLQLAKPSGDEYPFAEERRLFYVALTRARRGITILTLQHRHSPFLVELTKTMRLEVTNLDGEPGRTTPCPDPKCNGSLVPRKGKYGMFLGCTNYPTCQKKAKIANQ